MLLFFFVILIALFGTTQSVESIQLQGNISLGYYYADLYLGTPPQKQSFIIDTGSTLFAIPCNMCTSCGLRHLNPQFDLTKSNTSQLLTCQTGKGFCSGCQGKLLNQSCSFRLNYLQGSSINGIMVQDVVSLKASSNIMDSEKHNLQQLGTSHSLQKIQEPLSVFTNEIKSVFGCITKQTNHFLTQKADGIFGLSPNQNSNVLSQLVSKNDSNELAFSICIADNGGIFSIGARDTNLKTQNTVVVRYRTDNKIYSIGIDDILIGGKSLNLSALQIFAGDGITIDSGATYSYFPNIHYQKVIKIIQQVGKQLGFTQFSGQQSKCYQFPNQYNNTQISFQQQIDKFPPIQLKFGSKRIKWTPRNYFFVRNEQKRQACLGFIQLNRWILGNTWMLNKQIHFNLQRKQISISQSTCSHSLDYTPPKFHKMYSYDKPPLTQILFQLPNNVFIAIALVTGIILIIGVIVAALLILMKRNSRRSNFIQNAMQSIQMIKVSKIQHSEILQ